MFVELLATAVMVCTGLLVLLKRKLPAVDSKTAELVKHLKFYDTDDMQRDDKEMKDLRKENYLELVENYYNLTTDLFHIIWGPHYSMGVLFPKENHKWQSYPACQQMYQCYLGLSLQANENSVLGDFGCGTGGPTRCIAQFTGAKIKAVNITKYHLQTMQKWNEEMNIAHRIEPICSDYHHTPIESNSLDGVYMCESLGHSPDYKMLCREVFRVLKPGARFTGFNWE